ncbi:unnamed protein product [Orchesella dallaii]|uniref:Putative treble-clef zinc-finger domain-containing protein n=1 Tax=Orchesella dallaii TaxID=48710 RepID=A0ABP1QZ51_9HEXA
MPGRQDKWKDLFAGLGRPTKRGIRKCPKCGTVNGTRGNSCKNKACDVVFRNNGASKKTSTEACKLTVHIPELQVFSVRLRDRGPDYRNFVQLSLSSMPSPDGKQDSKCYVDTCRRNKLVFCGHMEAAQRCFSESQALNIEHSTVTSPNIPADQQQMLSMYLNEPNAVLVQRVSKTSFVVRSEVTLKHPLGYLHIMFFKHTKEDGTLEKKFLCTCKPYKVQNRDTDAQNNTTDGLEILSKLCVHYHACLCAFASDANLSSEFACFLVQDNPDCIPTLFNQLHLVTLPQPTSSTLVDGMDTNNPMTVEILRENISLMESNAFNTVDDGTLQNVNVQGLEGVLTDQIIVTNVDDSLSFGDGSGLDLDDGSSQVCQIFTSAQNAIQLATAFSNSENVHQTVNLANSTVLTSSNCGGLKRRRHISNDGTMQVATLTTQSIHPLTVTNHNEITNKPSHTKGPVVNKGFQSHTITQITPNPAISPHPQTHPLPLPSELELSNPEVDAFDRWLSQVNERLNTSMNYQFSGKPEPVVYFISNEYFERLKDRITSGVKKKRLPNQTLFISRTNKPPAGTFTKHIWKITNLAHVQQIFHSQVIPLKLSQYFFKGSTGIFEEWTPPNETDRKNQHIKPHLHSTYLKVGKNDPNAVDHVPFIIEWIPDILPQSKLGELSLIFEFGRSAPRDLPFSSL